MRSAILAFACILCCTCSSTQSPEPTEPKDEAPRATPAPEPATSGVPANQTLYEATAEFAEEVGALAEASGADCEAFADGLDRIMVRRAEWIEEMKRRSAAVKASGEPMPDPSPEMQRRLATAMKPLQTLSEVCKDNVRFGEAMEQAFSKVQQP